MKKTIMAIAIILGLSTTTFANGDGLFQRGADTPEMSSNHRTDGLITPNVPSHGQTGNQDAPLGSGIVLLATFGAAYWVGKRKKQE